MQTTTLKLNRTVATATLALLLGVSGLLACGRPVNTAPAAHAGSAIPYATASGCEEDCRALHRMGILPAAECDDGARALARMGLQATCRSGVGVPATASR